MRKLTNLLLIALVIFGISSTANALQYASGYSEIDLQTLSYSGNTSSVYTRNLGYYSAGYAFAVDQDEMSAESFSDFYYRRVLNDWAVAYTSDAFAAAGTYWGTNFSVAKALAGDGYGSYSGALAGTFVSAYQYYVPDGGDITISIDYYLESTLSGDDDEAGYAMAGAGAMLGIYQKDSDSSEGYWLDLAGGYEYDDVTGQLIISLSDLDTRSMFTVFAGTAAWAMAYAPGGDTAPVPEPATMLLLGTGLIGLAGFSRKKLTKK
jgi:hypothetical protein